MPIYRTGTNVYTPQQTGYGPTGAGSANTAGAIFHAGRFTTRHYDGALVESTVIPAPTRNEVSFTQDTPSFVASDHPLTGTVAGAATSVVTRISPIHSLTSGTEITYGDGAYGAGPYMGFFTSQVTATEINTREEIFHDLTASIGVLQNPVPTFYGAGDYGSGEYGGGDIDGVRASSMVVGHPLVATVSGTSTSTASSAIVTHLLVGNFITSSTAGATGIHVSHPLTGASGGSALADVSTIAIAQPLAADASGSSIVDGTGILFSHPLATTTTTTSDATASQIALEQPLDGSTGGTSSAEVLRIINTHQMTGVIAGEGTAFADLTPGSPAASNHPLSSTVAAAAVVAAERIVLGHPFAAIGAGASTASSSSVVVSHILVVTVAGTSTADATELLTETPHPLQAVMAGLSTATATLLSPTPDPFTFVDDETRIFIARVPVSGTFSTRRRAGIFD